MNLLNESEVRAFYSLGNSEVKSALEREFNILAAAQTGLRDEVELRWNQGRQQMIVEILKLIDESRTAIQSPAPPPRAGRHYF